MSIIGAAPAADEARSGPVLDIVDAPPSIRANFVRSSSRCRRSYFDPAHCKDANYT
jgi:hypothetical protein